MDSSGFLSDLIFGHDKSINSKTKQSSTPDQNIFKKPNLPEKMISDHHWECGDSMFSVIDDIDECGPLDTNEHNELQCTQRFIDDVFQQSSNSFLGQSFNIGGSQYETKEDIREKTAFRRDETIKRELQDIKDITWESQVFPEARPAFESKGPFYGLPVSVEKLIFDLKHITDLYDWQKECLQLPAIKKRENLIYALPTSGGKTLVAEILMLRELICREKNVLFILPYVSIVQEKVSSLAPFALNCNFLVEEYTAGKGRCPPPKRRKLKTLFIASIEKGALLFDSLIEANRANEIGLVVVDEMHLIGEKGRGSTLEAFLTKVLYISAGIQIVGMSATIGNLPEISSFLNADVYTRHFRPVELKEYLKCGRDILEINTGGQVVEDIFSYSRTVNFKYSENITKFDPDHLAGLVSEVIPDRSCLVFCSTKKNCENVALLLTKVLNKNVHTEHKRKQKESLMSAIDKMCGALNPVLKKTIPFGIVFHHSGLSVDERKLLELAYKLGTICVICCTSTLAAGVNLPAKRVIIRAPYVGSQFMTLCQYKQMSGRAGRAGLGDAGESILICPAKDNFQVSQMLFAPMDEVVSSLNDNDALGMKSLIISAIGLRVADCLKDLLQLLSMSLLAVQAGRLNVSIEQEVTSLVRNMFRHKILQVASNKSKQVPSNSGEIITTQEVRDGTNFDRSSVGAAVDGVPNDAISAPTTTIAGTKRYILSKSAKFDLTVIGRATFKAGIDYKRSEAAYNELRSAQKSLVLTDFSHLAYLVVGFGRLAETMVVEPTILFREYKNIDEGIQHLLKVIGITEVHIVRMFKTRSLRGPVEDMLGRIYRVMILNDFLNLVPVHTLSYKYSVERGTIQSLVNQAISATFSINRLCEEIEELWCFCPLFEKLCYKLDYCCTAELAPLLDLPAVKLGRAKQLYNAGYGTLEDLAKAKPGQLVEAIEFMPFRVAKEIISAARVSLLNRLEVLQEETEQIMSCLQ